MHTEGAERFVAIVVAWPKEDTYSGVVGFRDGYFSYASDNRLPPSYEGKEDADNLKEIETAADAELFFTQITNDQRFRDAGRAEYFPYDGHYSSLSENVAAAAEVDFDYQAYADNDSQITYDHLTRDGKLVYNLFGRLYKDCEIRILVFIDT